MALNTSVLTGGTNSHQTTSEEVNALGTDILAAGVIGAPANTGGVAPMTGGMAVNAQGSPDMTVAVSTGVIYVTGTPSGGNSQLFRVKNTVSTNVTISANASGGTRYDWLYVQLDATKLANPNSGGTDAASFVTSRSTSNTTDNGTPPTYGTLLAIITVSNGASSISNGNIKDSRTQTSITTAVNASSTSTSGWVTSTLPAVASVAANGNRSYNITFGSTVAAYLSPGMRLRTTRTATAPTQCTSLNGTTQYYSKSSPAGMTFTDDFVVSAWIKVSSYGQAVIASRYNGTSGWDFFLLSDGRVKLKGFSGGAGNYRAVQSYQSVPLNKWVHVAAQLDMSTFTLTATTNYVMIDGVDVPATTDQAGTNPTSLIQAGNLEIGSENGGTTFFPGKIAQVAIYNAKVTQATILASMHQGLAGTEASLVSAYSFNNSINDLNANANNLTANGSAVATNADSPFGGQADGTISSTLDYAIVTKVATTVATVQVPEGCTIPTSGGVTSVDFSAWKAPFGMPVQREKWTVLAQTGAGTVAPITQTNPANGTWYNLGSFQLSVPIGDWRLGYMAVMFIANATNANSLFSTLSTANNTAGDTDYLSRVVYIPVAAGGSCATVTREKMLSLSSATPYYLNGKTDVASATSMTLNPSTESSFIFAECAYL